MPISEALLNKIRTRPIESKLDLSGEGLCDEDLAALTDILACIKELDLSYNDIGDHGAMTLAGIGTIEFLDLHNGLRGYDSYENHITATGAKALAETGLKKLNLSGNPIGNQGIEFLASNKTITELRVSDCDISDQGSSTLFKVNSTITKVDLSTNALQDNGVKTLAANHTLKELDLSNCGIHEDGALCISENDSLTRLKLSANGIKNKGATRLAAHPALVSLDLRGCDISDDGIAAFSSNSGIQELFLSDNQITQEGLKRLSGNHSLVCLHLSNNPIEFDEETLKVLTGIETLRIFKGDNKISDEMITRARDLCAKTAVQEFDLMACGGFMNTNFLRYRAKKKAEEETPDFAEPRTDANKKNRYF